MTNIDESRALSRLDPVAKPRIALCLPRRPMVDTKHLNCLDVFKSALGKGGIGRMGPMDVHVLDAVEPHSRARTILTQRALANPNVTHLLWIDDDMIFAPTAGKRLLEHGLDIVGGLCHNRRPPYHPVIGRHPHPSWALPPTTYQWIYDYPEDQLVEANATGGAFLLIRREVFEAIAEKFGPDSWWKQYEELSEDLSFCWRAQACDFRIFIDTGLDIGHLAQVTVNKAFYKLNSKRRWGRWTHPLGPKSGTPAATVIIPTFNQKPEYLLAAAHSALGQTVPTEVIVVDDGSATQIGEMPAGVCVIRHEKNKGIAAALNTGIKAARAPFICWLSSDDLMSPDKVERQRDAMLDAGCKASFHAYDIWRNGNIEPMAAPIPNWRTLAEQMAALSRACWINGSTTMIHRDVFDDVGIFDTSFRYSQDWEFWCRVGEHYLWLGIDEVFGLRREDGNLSSRLDCGEDPAETQRWRDEDARICARYADEPA